MYMTELRCLKCGATQPADAIAYTCPHCGPGGDASDQGILNARYVHPAAARALRDGPQAPRTDIFRWLPLLPVGTSALVLPAGGTPLVPAPRLAAWLGVAELWLKDETRNPTRCLKERATALLMTQALALGRSDVCCASAGNAAISLAGSSAHLGIACYVCVPHEVSETQLAWLRRYGVDVHVSPAPIIVPTTRSRQLERRTDGSAATAPSTQIWWKARGWFHLRSPSSWAGRSLM